MGRIKARFLAALGMTARGGAAVNQIRTLPNRQISFSITKVIMVAPGSVKPLGYAPGFAKAAAPRRPSNQKAAGVEGRGIYATSPWNRGNFGLFVHVD
jgi:hypothetical protein